MQTHAFLRIGVHAQDALVGMQIRTFGRALVALQVGAVPDDRHANRLPAKGEIGTWAGKGIGHRVWAGRRLLADDVHGCPRGSALEDPRTRTHSGQRCCGRRRLPGVLRTSAGMWRCRQERFIKPLPSPTADLWPIGQPFSQLAPDCALEWLICSRRVMPASDGSRVPIRQGAFLQWLIITSCPAGCDMA
jgi:hypothetical protein